MNERLWISIHSEIEPIHENISFQLASILIGWSRFENGVAIDTSQLMHFPEVRRLADKAPLNFKGKIELWKRSIFARYPSDDEYKQVAAEICSKGKVVSHHRHRLVHGTWRASNPEEHGSYQVFTLKGLDVVEELEAFWVDEEYLAAVHKDIRTVTDAFFEFVTNRALHGSGAITLGATAVI